MHAQGAANLCWEQELTNHTRLDSFSVSVRTGSLVQSCSVLCDLRDYSPPDSSVLGIVLVRILGVGYHLLFQVIFPTRGSNPHLLYLLLWQLGSSIIWKVPTAGMVGKNPMVRSEVLGSSSANIKNVIAFPSTITAAAMITNVSVF